MIECKNQCIRHLKTSKIQTYDIGGCYCKTCNQYFTEKYVRCPCCNVATRQKPRSNRRIQNSLSRVV